MATNLGPYGDNWENFNVGDNIRYGVVSMLYFSSAVILLWYCNKMPLFSGGPHTEVFRGKVA